MVSPLFLRRLSLAGLTGLLAACTSQATFLATTSGLASHRSTQFITNRDSLGELLTRIPSSIPTADAAQLIPIAPEQIATSFETDTFTGIGGMFRGFAPGFTAEIFGNSLFLPVDGLLIPYTQSAADDYVPLVFFSQNTGFYFYPALRIAGDLLVPIFFASRALLAPYITIIPVIVPPTYVSPIDIIFVPAPIVVRPIIIRPRPRPVVPHPRPTLPISPRPTPPTAPRLTPPPIIPRPTVPRILPPALPPGLPTPTRPAPVIRRPGVPGTPVVQPPPSRVAPPRPDSGELPIRRRIPRLAGAGSDQESG
ncbi:MAG: hypothetical protein HY692_06230 [Cyanobacteria bacterium NC_groundwater_1444_Ag_S-0.65um_54_12]|nr:hypothetical protein [Cyanobacteria bacterium NC_groundwater_1444_Ag_S-0.65um_54_12]